MTKSERRLEAERERERQMKIENDDTEKKIHRNISEEGT